MRLAADEHEANVAVLGLTHDEKLLLGRGLKGGWRRGRWGWWWWLGWWGGGGGGGGGSGWYPLTNLEVALALNVAGLEVSVEPPAAVVVHPCEAEEVSLAGRRRAIDCKVQL